MKEIDKDKQERIEKKMKAFMVDMAAEMLDDGSLKKIREVVVKKLHKAGSSATLTSLRVLSEGFEMGVMASQNDMEAPMMSGIAKIVDDEQKRVNEKIQM